MGPWTAWLPTTDWSPCTAGLQTRTEQRTRTVLVPPQNGGATPVLVETRIVSQVCRVPVDAVVGPWTDWTPTSAWSPCAAGLQTRTAQRTRAVVTPAQDGGTTPALSETRTVLKGCPVDGDP